MSWPSQAMNLPVSSMLALSTTSIIFITENWVENSLSLGTPLWYGRERSVSVVPGWRHKHSTLRSDHNFSVRNMRNFSYLDFPRPCSIARFLFAMLRAALDILYPYQPPSLLSEMEPTLK